LKHILATVLLLLSTGCPRPVPVPEAAEPPRPPRGYVDRVRLRVDGTQVGFGPFVGYYFKPVSLEDLTHLEFRCYNERGFYTDDLPENALLFTGSARFRRLPDSGNLPRGNARILPVVFRDAPDDWKATRPEPADEYLHFHSAYDAVGPVRAGFWLRHVGTASFTYNMGGRVDETSVLHHQVNPGVDKAFARILEFDRGPGKQSPDNIH
ncbi:MAG: hypothetical protein WD708_04410, partial [Kiritimatiellia bacterium]